MALHRRWTRPLSVLLLSLFPGLGSAVQSRVPWPLFYEAPAALALLLITTWRADPIFNVLLFAFMLGLALRNHRRALEPARRSRPYWKEGLKAAALFVPCYLLLLALWTGLVARHWVIMRAPLKPLLQMEDRLLFVRGDYRRGDLLRTPDWPVVLAGFPGETVTLAGLKIYVDSAEIAAGDYGYLKQIPSKEVLTWGPVPADTYLCVFPYEGSLKGAFIPRVKLQGRALWHYRSGQ